ncbi:MAG: hypothetical protein FWD58_09860 [Firmicutes bacterium]|nr:hypothetical protein [Bacillota bacterium]
MNNKLILPKYPQKGTTINRTIRFDGDVYDELSALVETSGMSFNKLVNVCLRYAIENAEQEETTGVIKK